MFRIFWSSSQCLLIDVYLDLESPRGSGFWVGEGGRVTEGNKEGVSLRASGSRGGRVLTQEEGSPVSRQGEQGEQGEQGADLVHKSKPYLAYVCDE
jgi:hypothetical protein